MKKNILLGLNELNFPFIEKYIELGYLKNFKYLFDQYGYLKTVSEKEYKLLEPWVQWTTIHTGKTYDEHRVFRLGDIVNRKDLQQIWEIGEEKGKSIGAVSPFNADNRLKNAKFFVPDPWTKTHATGEKFIVAAADAVSQAVNDNAQAKITKKSILALLTAFIKTVPFHKYISYVLLALKVKSKKGIAAIILDNLLADIFIQQWRKYQPDFSSLFLNTGAHCQHHYMFNSKVYEGTLSNPYWYCKKDDDPLLRTLQNYDKIIGRLLNLDVNLLVATGLSQQPHEELTYYWRLNSHKEFLKEIGVDFAEVFPRMSRDFLIQFKTEEDVKKAEKKLQSYIAPDKHQIFNIDNRGNSLFIELIYPKEITENFTITNGNNIVKNFKQYVSFVAIKNGEHNSTGYFIDTSTYSSKEIEVPLTSVFDKIVSHFDS